LAVVCVHLHCSARRGCLSGPGRVPAEDRRLAAEEGSYSLKTWLRKISRGWASSSTGPQPRPVSTVLLSYLSPHWTGMVGRLLLDPLIHQPPRASRPSYLSWSRTEDWQQKKDRTHRRPGRGRLEEAGELLSRALPRLLVKSVLLSRTETNFTRSSSQDWQQKTQRRECEEVLDPAL